MTVTQMNIKSKTHYFYNELINIKFKFVKIRQKNISGS